ncbi:trigger factor [Salinispirillum marinum]|uniref:Trigger factor n=2 Tax=Saccharospirillaceae TaxID=255527 RepID=A0ABV8BGI1_9GAMM
MQVTVEATSGLERRMVINVPADKIDSEVDKRVKDTARRVRLDGFRPGKVPVSVVRQRFGQGIRAEVLQDVVRDSYVEALDKESIVPAGYPRFEDVKDEGGQVEFTAVFEVFPEVTLGDFSALAVDVDEVDVTDENVDQMIDTLRKQRAEYKAVKRKSVKEDKVKIDFVGKVDGEVFEGGSAEGQELVLGSGSMIPGFEDGIIGMKAGEEKTIDVTFPEQYGNADLAGKAATFDITVHEVLKPEMPELDEAFIKELGARETTVEGFRAEVKENMEREARQSLRNKSKGVVIDQLLASNSFDVPASMVDQEIDRLRQDAVQQFGGQAKIDASQLPKELFQDQAVRRVKTGLIFSKIAEQFEIKADEAAVRKYIEDIAAVYQDPQSVIDYYYNNREQLAQVQSAVMEEAVIAAVLKDAAVKTSTVDYYTAVKRED